MEWSEKKLKINWQFLFRNFKTIFKEINKHSITGSNITRRLVKSQRISFSRKSHQNIWFSYYFNVSKYINHQRGVSNFLAHTHTHPTHALERKSFVRLLEQRPDRTHNSEHNNTHLLSSSQRKHIEFVFSTIAGWRSRKFPVSHPRERE